MVFAVQVVCLLPLPPSRVGAADGPVCTGDCDGVWSVTIGNIVTLVNIVLGNLPAAACAAGLGSATPDIAVIIQAVNNALGSCPELATPTLTPTATASPTVTPTPGPPDVSGVWREENLQLVSSNCNSATAGVIAQALASVPAVCDISMVQTGLEVRSTDCEDDIVDGTVDMDGTVRLTQYEVEPLSDRCTLTGDTGLVFDATRSPTTGRYTMALTFTGVCSPFASCTAQIESRLTRQ